MNLNKKIFVDLFMTLMDVCINESCTNAVYKHVQHDKWCQNLFVDKIENFKKKH